MKLWRLAVRYDPYVGR